VELWWQCNHQVCELNLCLFQSDHVFVISSSYQCIISWKLGLKRHTQAAACVDAAQSRMLRSMFDSMHVHVQVTIFHLSKVTLLSSKPSMTAYICICRHWPMSIDVCSGVQHPDNAHWRALGTVARPALMDIEGSLNYKICH
jgi:hypothetical protein